VTLEHRIGRVIAVLGLIFILVATLTPRPSGVAASATTSFWCLVCGDHGGVDVTLNLLLFLPFAVGLRLAGVSRWRTIVASALLTIFVESMQAAVITGRDASLSDLLTNTISGAIGATLAPSLRLLAVPERSTARIFAMTWAAGWLALQAAAAWLFQPWSPGGTLRADWDINLPSYQTFSGRILSAAADGMPLSQGPLSDSTALRQRFTAGDVRLSVDAIVGAPHAEWAPAMAVFGGNSLVSMVFDVHDDLVLELSTNAARVRLANAALRLDGGRPPVAGALVRVTGGSRGRTLWLASSYGGEHRHAEIDLSPSFAWSLLVPLNYAYGPETRWLTMLWIVGLLFPLGYWTRRARASAPTAALARRQQLALEAVAAGSVVLGLAVVPRVAGFAPVHPSEWVAAAVGLGAGWAVARRVTYLAGRCVSRSASESCSS